jgi:serine/threonine protein kinase
MNYKIILNDRKNKLNSNEIFNNEFEINNDTFELKNNILTNNANCLPFQKEFFSECFFLMGQGKYAEFYSSTLQDSFGIKKTKTDEYLDNEIKILSIFRKHIDDFPFITHMYGWTKINNTLYIIIEKKDKNLSEFVKQYITNYLITNNENIVNECTKLFINILKILKYQLKKFHEYGIFHQDLHNENILIKEYDDEIEINIDNEIIKTKYVPYIHDFDFAGIRDTLKQVELSIYNEKWEYNIGEIIQYDMDSDIFTSSCHDYFQLYNSMVELFIISIDNKFYSMINLIEISELFFGIRAVFYYNSSGGFFIYNDKIKKLNKLTLQHNINTLHLYNTNITYTINLKHPEGFSKNDMIFSLY